MKASELERLRGEIRLVGERLLQLDEEVSDTTPGVWMMLEGLERVLEHLEQSELSEQQSTQLAVLIQGLNAVVDFLQKHEGQEESEEVPMPTPEAGKAPGLEQFIAAFRTEARKRLSGLSLSMMGIFNEHASESSLEQSAQHLHAIRGGAAMLNLSEIAELSGAMEQVLVSMRKLEPSQRDWPTQSLLRGYHLIETSMQSEDVHLDREDSQLVIAQLRDCLDSITSRNEHPTPRRELPIVEPPKDNQAPTPEPSGLRKPDLSKLRRDTFLSAQPKTIPRRAHLEQRILIVDDMEMIAASVGFVLSELDVPIDIATNGQVALEMLRERPYSLVITDIAMPRMDGVALTQMIREDDALRDIPVILLTALDHPAERDAGLEAGANDYIIKGSIGGGELVSRVRELLKIAPFVPADVPPPRGTHRILVAEDAETVAASIAFVLSEGSLDIVLASNGREALERLQRESFDLLLSDWQMPSMSGLELIQKVRTIDKLEGLPIILLTSLSSDTVRQQGLDAGANAFFVKGEVGGGKLLEVVESLLTKNPSNEE